MDKSTLKQYTEKTKEVVKRVGGQFVDTSVVLNRALDANIGRDGIKLTKDGKFHFSRLEGGKMKKLKRDVKLADQKDLLRRETWNRFHLRLEVSYVTIQGLKSV